MAGIGDTKYIIKAHPTAVRKFNPNNINNGIVNIPAPTPIIPIDNPPNAPINIKTISFNINYKKI